MTITDAKRPHSADDQTRQEDTVVEIDKALADLHVVPPAGKEVTDDVDPTSLEGRLRLALPGHTYFRISRAVPETLIRILETIGAETDSFMAAPTSVKALFSEPAGVWKIEVQACHQGDHGYRVQVDGPATNITRDTPTIDGVITLIDYCRNSLRFS